ncbi:MAG: bifunctional diaminohydroxyphosphoribosylaminopyrimidine deaminase/5-amino-6-(5-phosphoribosylamino)uracil reductase RibD [Flavobacteriales bacterium]|nr:bifunctional diaminohydroxyphosphoribosylaminopyrimidine deaminase/5-amino-6-(5-phosphoribosylamino)uracil reductase RibD [Flavobacteriales bacterium]
MLRCIELAQLGAGSVAPNPMVGCVIVHNGSIIGEGYHRKIGEAHAEVNAINAVADASLLPQATLYVSLEPCAHFGKTPPCANLIIEKKIKRVVIACLDPFAQVNGAGIKRLMDAGVDVRLGVCEREALELNRRFITFHRKKRPYIILKWAETSNGSVDDLRTDSSETPLKITCEAANILVHKWRSEEAAIMVGAKTIKQDNPSLTTRKYAGKNPIRIVLDSKFGIPENAQVLDGVAETLVFTESQTGFESNNHEFVTVADTRNLESVLTELHNRNIQSVIVEGGPTLHRSFYEAGLWDEIRRFVAPISVSQGVKALQVSEFAEEELVVGDDRLLIYRNR